MKGKKQRKTEHSPVDELLCTISQEAQDDFPQNLTDTLNEFLRSSKFRTWRRKYLTDYILVDLGDNASDDSVMLAKMFVRHHIDIDDPILIDHLAHVLIHIAMTKTVDAAIDNHRRELDERAEKEDE
jgi:hypothetical protein